MPNDVNRVPADWDDFVMLLRERWGAEMESTLVSAGFGDRSAPIVCAFLGALAELGRKP